MNDGIKMLENATDEEIVMLIKDFREQILDPGKPIEEYIRLNILLSTALAEFILRGLKDE
jgi:hypothetical protein